eukprot:985559-Prorocentrum_minimum.AAC.1
MAVRLLVLTGVVALVLGARGSTLGHLGPLVGPALRPARRPGGAAGGPRHLTLGHLGPLLLLPPGRRRRLLPAGGLTLGHLRLRRLRRLAHHRVPLAALLTFGQFLTFARRRRRRRRRLTLGHLRPPRLRRRLPGALIGRLRRLRDAPIGRLRRPRAPIGRLRRLLARPEQRAVRHGLGAARPTLGHVGDLLTLGHVGALARRRRTLGHLRPGGAPLLAPVAAASLPTL